MRSREAANSLPSPRTLVLGLGCAALVALTGCGADDFPNNPRPAAPVELTAAIDQNSVSIAPSDPDAGTVTVTISNQTDNSVKLVLDGPTTASSGDIPPQGTGSIKTTLKEGDYEASAGAEVGIKPAKVTVGPPGESSQNDLLLP